MSRSRRLETVLASLVASFGLSACGLLLDVNSMSDRTPDASAATDGGLDAAGRSDATVHLDGAPPTDSAAPFDASVDGRVDAPSRDASPDTPVVVPDANCDALICTTATVVGYVPGGIPGPGTTFAGCSIFPPDNAWNVRVDGPSVVTIPAATFGILQTSSLRPYFGPYTPAGTTDSQGFPFTVVDASQPLLPIAFDCYSEDSDPGPDGWLQDAAASPLCPGAGSANTTAWPFSATQEIENDPAPSDAASVNVSGWPEGSARAITLQQLASGACMLYEGNGCLSPLSPAVCVAGAVFNLSSDALRPGGNEFSAEASGLAIFPGLVRLADIKQGVITHAIGVMFEDTQYGYILPATAGWGDMPTGSAHPPLGLRLRLKASVNISGFDPAAQVVLRAMQEYGIIVADRGIDWAFVGDSDDSWNDSPDGGASWFDVVTSGTSQILGSDFEVIYSGEVIPQQ